MNDTHKYGRSAALWVLLLGMLCVLPATAQQTIRNLSGTVTDPQHEPIRGAVVELQNPANSSVTTYVTAADGLYTFKRLDGNSDYLVWVLWRGHKSRIRSISKFDSHMAKVVNFTVRNY